MLRFGSLFAGIGGFDYALEKIGMKCVWQVEIDDYATKILEKNFSNVKQYRDVREVGKHNLEKVDLICGGFPCQDISVAGKRKGIKGERSGLWAEFKRIIEEMGPSWVLIENVSALRSNGLVTVLQDISEVGYDAEWHCIPASAVGAPHRRDRIWIVAYPRRALFEGSLKRKEDENEVRKENADIIKRPSCTYSSITNTNSQRPQGYSEALENISEICTQESFSLYCSERHENEWSIEPNVGRVANGISNRVDRLKCLGNAIVPQIVEYIGIQILKKHEQKTTTASD